MAIHVDPWMTGVTRGPRGLGLITNDLNYSQDRTETMNITSSQLVQALTTAQDRLRHMPPNNLTPAQLVSVTLATLREEILTIEFELQQRKESQANMDRPSSNKAI